MRLEAKNSSLGPANYWNIDGKRLSARRCRQEFATKKKDREVEPKRSSFSGKIEVAKLFLCSKLSSNSC